MPRRDDNPEFDPRTSLGFYGVAAAAGILCGLITIVCQQMNSGPLQQASDVFSQFQPVPAGLLNQLLNAPYLLTFNRTRLPALRSQRILRLSQCLKVASSKM
eukprot:g26589.t1